MKKCKKFMYTRKDNSYIFCVGTEIIVVITENIVEIPHETRNRITLWPCNQTAEYTSMGNAPHQGSQWCMPVGKLTHIVSLTMSRSCVGNCHYCKFMCVASTSCPRDSISIATKSYLNFFHSKFVKTISIYLPSIYHLYLHIQACRG